MKERTVNAEERSPNDRQLLWYEEIVRETDHYYQGEMQHDQRASWLLATSAVLIALVVSSDSFSATNTNPPISDLLVGALSAFAVSAFIAVVTLLPLRGTWFWRDFTGKSHRHARRLTAHQLVEEKFRHNNQLSCDQYEKRIEHHFRSHYLRASSKAYGVIWSSLILIVGIVLFTAAAVLIVA
jgi:hypothetical protein